MTREEYLALRGSTSFNLLYEYYKEFFKEDLGVFLPFMEFVQCMQMWPGIRSAHDRVISHYDQKFNVVVLMDKDNKVISYL